MSSFESTLESIANRREVVAAHYHLPSGMWVAVGTTVTKNGAVIIDSSGQIVRTCSSKRAALAMLKGEIPSATPDQLDFGDYLSAQGRP